MSKGALCYDTAQTRSSATQSRENRGNQDIFSASVFLVPATVIFAATKFFLLNIADWVSVCAIFLLRFFCCFNFSRAAKAFAMQWTQSFPKNVPVYFPTFLCALSVHISSFLRWFIRTLHYFWAYIYTRCRPNLVQKNAIKRHCTYRWTTRRHFCSNVCVDSSSGCDSDDTTKIFEVFSATKNFCLLSRSRCCQNSRLRGTELYTETFTVDADI